MAFIIIVFTGAFVVLRYTELHMEGNLLFLNIIIITE